MNNCKHCGYSEILHQAETKACPDCDGIPAFQATKFLETVFTPLETTEAVNEA